MKDPASNPVLKELIEKLHTAAVQAEQDFYTDPVTGLLVMTERCLKLRGYCCRSACRHCPYGFER